jgi:uncharacterized protein
MIMFELNTSLLLIMLCAGLLSGFGKTTGLSVLGIFIVTILSLILPAKEAVGILLPILLMGDIITVTYYRRTVIWKHLFSLVPWILVGIILGYFVLLTIDNSQLKLLLGYLIISLNLFQIIKDLMGSKMNEAIPNSTWFTGMIGILAGFATMIGNVAGAVMAVYLLSRRLPKNEFVGTGAWFFLFVNVIKVPFYIHLDMITSKSLLIDLMVIPAVIIGTFIGIKVLPLIPQSLFKWIILALGTLGAMKLIVPNLYHYILVWHIAAVVVCLITGLLVAIKKVRVFSGKLYCSAYTGAFITTTALTIIQWEKVFYFLFIGVFSYSLALFGYIARKKRWYNWQIKHLGGIIGSYSGIIIAVIAVFYSSFSQISSTSIILMWLFFMIVGATIIYWIGNRFSYDVDDKHSLGS